MEFSLTAQGLVIPSFQDIRDFINGKFQSAFGTSIALDDESFEGTVIGILSDVYRQIAELVEAVHNSQDPNAAFGAALDALASLTGTLRRGEIFSTVVATLTGDPGTIIDEGSQVSVVGTDERFATDEEVTLVVVDTWTATPAAKVLGDRETNEDRVYQVIVAGNGGVSAPTGTGTSNDDEVVWQYIGEGTAAADVATTAVNPGPILATSQTMTQIETPISGWESVVNLLDADLGRLLETDEDLRIRRFRELARLGAATKNAITAAVSAVNGVLSVRVFSNVTDETDADGVPPHSVEVLVRGGEDQDIWQAIFENVADGIRTHGDEIGTVVDSEGEDQEIHFSRPEEIEIYVDVEIIKDPDTYPENGDDQIKAAIVTYGDAQQGGKDAVASAISAQMFAIPGVLDVVAVLIDTSPGPSTSTTIPISLRQLAVYDTSRITVDSSADGVP